MRAWLALTAALALACDPRSEEAARPRAEFGVFFGGQIQERDEIPFELETTKQVQGFRVELPEPAQRDVSIGWELAKPERGKKTKKGSDPPETVQRGSGVIRAGERRFERTVQFRPGDPVGLWNIRIVMGDRVLLDRPFTVYDPVRRAMLRRQQPDAGATAR